MLVRGGNVTTGYFNNAEATAEAFANGWFHTGDIGELDEAGGLLIKGRKKEMIVLPDGRNVFPEDVERALNSVPGVTDSAVVGLRSEAGERVHAVLALESGSAEDAVRQANLALEEHQKIRTFTVWPEPELPRTEGTRKLKRREIRARVSGEVPAAATKSGGTEMEALLERFSAGREVSSGTTLDELGLSSLDRVELLVAMEQKMGVTLDENAIAGAKTVADLEALRRHPATSAIPPQPFHFPTWNRHWLAQAHRIVYLNLIILPLARVFAWVKVEGKENLRGFDGPAVVASNHQGYYDTPIVYLAMPFRWRHKLAVAMRKEFFEPWFHPERFPWYRRWTSGLGYLLSALFFNAFPIPQREAGTRQTLRYMGELVSDGWCPLIFPEGKHSEDDTILPFQAGAAMIAARLGVPVIPVRVRGSNRVLHPKARMARFAQVHVKIGSPVKLEGEDYAALAKKLEDIIRAM